MAMTLSDAFNRRKKLAADLQSWIQRLAQAGTEKLEYRTKAVQNESLPTVEQIARATPTRADGVNVFEHGDGFIKHRSKGYRSPWFDRAPSFVSKKESDFSCPKQLS